MTPMSAVWRSSRTSGSLSCSSAKNTSELAVVVLPRMEQYLVDPPSRSATESGADFTNWGRFPTTEENPHRG